MGRKERADLKDQVIFDLLPQAFTRSRQTAVIIDTKAQRIFVDCATAKRAEQVVSALRSAVGTLPVAPAATAVALAESMNEWLRNPRQLPAGIDLGDRCELKAAGDEKASVKCTAVDLRSEEVLAHLNTGMRVIRLNLCWNDEIEFDLTETLEIKRVRPLEQMNDQMGELDVEDAVDELHARISLQGGVLRELVDNLLAYFEVPADTADAA